jgi:hypothetical protein
MSDQVSQNAASQMSSQIQQLMSSLAASSGGNPGTPSNNTTGNQNLSSFLAGFSGSGQTDNSSLMLAMQNAAQYNNLLAQAQAQAQAANQQNQISALSNLAMQLSRGAQPSGLGLGLQNPLASFFDGKYCSSVF